MCKYYVDCDGTLVSNAHDDRFVAMIAKVGIDNAIAWYRQQYVADLPLNTELIAELIDLREKGHTLILWTNRSENERPMTQENLGVYWHLFSEHRFREGAKGNDVLDGVVYDNDPKYLACGTSGVLIQFDG